MLPLPIHNCDTHDVVPFFQPFLASQGRAVAEKLNRDAVTFQRVRKAALDHSDLETSCLNIFTYSECVSNFISRIESFESDLNISFSWNDAFKPQMKVVNTSFYVDWACMVWNLGANASRFACQADRGQEHGLKIANKYFQVAAGAFDYIIETIAPHFRVTTVANSNNLMPCLSTFGLQFAKNLTLAQGQQCFFEKANRDRKMSSINPSVPAMKAALIAKLAKEASSLFEQAQNSLLTYNSQFQSKSSASFMGSGSSSKPDFDPIWLAYCTFQSKYLAAYAEYYQGQAAKDAAAQVGRGYSEELTRLTVSEGLLRDALGGILNNAALGQLEQPVRDLLDLVVFGKRQADVENAQVYLEQPPAYSSLPLISRQSLSKPLNISAVNASSTGPVSTLTDHLNLFAGLFPKPVLEAMTSIKDMYNKNQVKVTEVSMQATQSAKSALAAVGLPGTVQAYRSKNESGIQIPDPLWEKVKQNQQLGGLADISQRLGDLFINSRRILDNIEEIERAIKDEISKDMQFQNTYFGYASSIVANMPKTEELINKREGKPNQKSLRENIDQLKDTYDLSQKSDLLLISNMIKGGEIPTEDAKRIILVDMASKGKYSDWFLSLSSDPGVLTLANECDEVCHATSKDNLIEVIEAINIRHGDNAPSPFKFLTSAQSHETSRIDEIVSNIDSALVKLSEVFDHRHLKVVELRDLSYSDNIEKLYSERLILAYNGSIAVGKHVAADAVKAVVDTALATVNGMCGEIFDKISFQTSLIQQILSLNGEFVVSLGHMDDPKFVYQNKIIGKVEMFINYITAWREQLINGNVFYSNLQRNVKSVRDDIDAIAHSQLAYRSESEMSLAVNRKESPHPPHVQYQLQFQQQQHQPIYNGQAAAPPLSANSGMSETELIAKANRIAEMGFEKEAVMRVLLSLNGSKEATIAALLSETSQAAPPPVAMSIRSHSRPHEQPSCNSGSYEEDGGSYTGAGSLPISMYSNITAPLAAKPDRAVAVDHGQDCHFVTNSPHAPPIFNPPGGSNSKSQSLAQNAIGIPTEPLQQQQQQQYQQQQQQQQQQHQSSNWQQSGPSGYNSRVYHTPTLPMHQQFSTGGHGSSGVHTAPGAGGGGGSGGGSTGGYQYYPEPNAPANIANNTSTHLPGFKDIVLMKTSNGFGFKLVECAIIEILPNIQVVSTTNGNLMVGDILTDVNDQNLGGVGKSQQELAVTILMSVPNFERTKLRFRDPKVTHHSNSNSNNSGTATHSYSASRPSGNIVNSQNQSQFACQYAQHAPMYNGHNQGFTHPSQQQQQFQQQQHQPIYNGQATAPPLSANSGMGETELNAKANRIAEMGFEKEAVMRVLLSLNGSEEATIAALLSETSQAAPPPVASTGSGSAARTGTEKEKKGLFGGFFSSKK